MITRNLQWVCSHPSSIDNQIVHNNHRWQVHVYNDTNVFNTTEKRPIMVVNPLIIKEVNALDVPDSIKKVLHDILKVEDEIEAGDDRHVDTRSIKRILERYADNNEVVEFCDKYD